jgi:6-phosphogluconolactonase
MTTLHTRRFASRAQLDAALVERLAQAIADTSVGGSAVMLSGGSTPMPAYRKFAEQSPQHNDNLRILFSDERYVPATSEKSNFHQSSELLEALALPEASVLRVRTELPLEQAAEDYERRLGELLKSKVPIGLGLLGLGPDGHTASLFRAADLDRARGHLAIAVQRPDGMSGISVTPEFLTHVKQLVFVVAGGGKYDAIQSLLKEDPNLVAWRAVQGLPSVELWVEQAALSSLMA